ncbi:hypothetical protein L1987_57131 [Smallanthus sonchifolius]|uniref:Uncharacterized protein n=1 Tax=Smallanthus sonchifolius TaxID=185202 RepID=A0ACB9DBR7_9ASTR|nr:hypothetical protein L1987_57131 [Smallanthus sonchifolius]
MANLLSRGVDHKGSVSIYQNRACYRKECASFTALRKTTGARVKVDDTRRDERSLDDAKSMAVEAVLLLQGMINKEDEGNAFISLLVPCKFIGCIIGKSGSTINEIRTRTRAYVRVSKGADANDDLVEVIGEVGSVRDALVQIVLRLRDDILKECFITCSFRLRSEMLISGHAFGKVMGKGVANVDNISKISGAVVEISDTKSSRGDLVAVISRTPEQRRAAENMIQAFILAT